MPMKAIPARSWIARCWKATRTACSKAWPSPPTPSARSKGYIYVRAEYPLAVKHLQDGHPPGRAAGPAGQQHLRHAVQLPHRYPAGRGRVRLRRRDGADRFDRRQARHAAAAPALSRAERAVGLPDADQQRRDVRQRRADHPQRRASGSPRIGTEKSKGTKVFALAGRVDNTGLIEVPMGITLREIIFDIGGGIPDGRKFKAVQTGGPSGGCIPEQYLDMPVDYESLAKVGSIMGSGGMIVMDETSSMVDVAKFFMDFCLHESCGKCVPAGWAPPRCTICSTSWSRNMPPAATWSFSRNCVTWSVIRAYAA